MKSTPIKLHLTREQVKPFAMDEYKSVTENDLAMLGFTADAAHAGVKMAMDAAPNLVAGGATTPNVAQFFQYWLPNAIKVLTEKRNADAVLGRTIVGDWDIEEVVQKVMEHIGQVQPYGDHTDVPLVSYNPSFERRQNVRFELGMMSGKLEDARASRMMIAPEQEKRAAIATAFAIGLNEVAFNGFNSYSSSSNTMGCATYGILNDANLGAYDATVNKTFATSTFAEMTSEINTWLSALRIKSGNNFNPYADKFQLSIAPTAFDAMMTTMNSLGTKTVAQWFTETYKGGSLLCVNEYADANGSSDVAYIIVDSLGGEPVVRQMVTAEMRLIGIEPKLKGTLEGYTASTAGTLVAQPLGVYRATGV